MKQQLFERDEEIARLRALLGGLQPQPGPEGSAEAEDARGALRMVAGLGGSGHLSCASFSAEFQKCQDMF